jgi:hypothetical protein
MLACTGLNVSYGNGNKVEHNEAAETWGALTLASM